MSLITLESIRNITSQGDKFACSTAYDACFASIIGEAGIEILLIGDSLGMVLQGKNSTLPVTVEEISYHTANVARGRKHSLIMADMPFMSCATPDQSLRHATQVMQSGAEILKLEGGTWLCETIQKLDQGGIPVCAHLGLTPQSVHKFSGYKVQAKSTAAADKLINDAQELVNAGAVMILVECIPSQLTEQLVNSISVPVIGIGAGPAANGQILVMHDLLGITPGKPAKFVKNFMAQADSIQDAFAQYAMAVKNGSYPTKEQSFEMSIQ